MVMDRLEEVDLFFKPNGDDPQGWWYFLVASEDKFRPGKTGGLNCGCTEATFLELMVTGSGFKIESSSTMSTEIE